MKPAVTLTDALVARARAVGVAEADGQDIAFDPPRLGLALRPADLA